MMYLVWVFLPCAALISCVAGHIWRYRRDRFLAYLYGPRIDRAQWLGSLAFRTGVPLLAAVRVIEMAVSGPHSRVEGTAYVLLMILQFIAVPLAIVGAGLILVPPLIAAESRPRVTPVDRITLPVLVGTMVTAVLITFDPNSTDDRYRTAETLFTWIRSLVTLQPNPEVMQHAPALYQIRGLIVMVLIAIWPYTRLAGIFTVPLLRLARGGVRAARRLQVPPRRELRPDRDLTARQ
ncbi:respiratory nitrate reductase subunit gamma [Nocardia sp. NPDC057668]|uniref:respiratory nitrate reductase subunit gamma n=1 Tax=Nocardia sp. NPDC057668 TaxID=3346202 RepID=UPI00366B34F1